MRRAPALSRALLIALAALPPAAPAGAQTRAVTCDELAWSAAMLAANPDIGRLCQGVYVKGERYYAKAFIRVLRVSGPRIVFRPLRTDGTLGERRAVTVPADWRVRSDGRTLLARDLRRGQELTVFIPEDRFAIAVQDADGPQATDLLPVEGSGGG